jgi:hypothetical protein
MRGRAGPAEGAGGWVPASVALCFARSSQPDEAPTSGDLAADVIVGSDWDATSWRSTQQAGWAASIMRRRSSRYCPSVQRVQMPA